MKTRYILLLLATAVLAMRCGTTRKQQSPAPQEAAQTQPAFEKGFAPIGPVKLYYEIHGKGGTPLVLLHGGGSTIQTTFGETLPLFARHRQVIAVELQSHGHTRDVDRPLTFEQDADDVAGLLTFLKIPKADVLGFSNGGNTAMQLCVRHPEMVNKLVAMSAFYKREGMMDGFFGMMQHATLASMPAPLKTAYLAVVPDSSALESMHNKDRDRMVQFKDWPDQTLQAIAAPTLIVAGDHDVVTTEHTAAMARVIPHASLLILPGNHGSFIGEICSIKEGSIMPGVTVQLVEEFLDEKIP